MKRQLMASPSSALWAVVLPVEGTGHRMQRGSMYQKPTVQRFGTFRDLTQAGGPQNAGDGVSLYHRS